MNIALKNYWNNMNSILEINNYCSMYYLKFNDTFNIINSRNFIKNNKYTDFNFYNYKCLDCSHSLYHIIWQNKSIWDPQSCNELIIKRLLE